MCTVDMRHCTIHSGVCLAMYRACEVSVLVHCEWVLSVAGCPQVIHCIHVLGLDPSPQEGKHLPHLLSQRSQQPQMSH